MIGDVGTARLHGLGVWDSYACNHRVSDVVGYCISFWRNGSHYGLGGGIEANFLHTYHGIVIPLVSYQCIFTVDRMDIYIYPYLS